MKFFKAFSGEETEWQKKKRQQFFVISTAIFTILIHITRIDKLLMWQQKTTRNNQMKILVVLGTLMLLMVISVFIRDSFPTDTTAASNWQVVKSIATQKEIQPADDPRILRLSQLLDSLEVNENQMNNDSVYRERMGRIILDKLVLDGLMDKPDKLNNDVDKN